MPARCRWILPILAAGFLLSIALPARAQEPWCWSLQAEAVGDHLEIRISIGPDLQAGPDVVGYRLLRETIEACGAQAPVPVGKGPIPLGGGVVVDADVQEALSYRYELKTLRQDGSLTSVWDLCGVDTATWAVEHPLLYTSRKGWVFLGTGRVREVDGRYESEFCSLSCEGMVCSPPWPTLPDYVEKPGGGHWTAAEMAASGLTFRFHGPVHLIRSWEGPDCRSAIVHAEMGSPCSVPAGDAITWGALRARY